MTLTVQFVLDEELPKNAPEFGKPFAEGPPYNLSHLGGWWKGGTWEDYLKIWKPEVHPHFNAVRDYIKKYDIHSGANEVCNDYTFLFSDGSIMSTSWRAWGDLLGAIWEAPDYLDYYYR